MKMEEIEEIKDWWLTINVRTHVPTEVANKALDDIPTLLSALEAAQEENKGLRKRKDDAYEERNRVVAALARAAVQIGLKAIRTRTAIEGWSEDWHGCVYIDLPTGQVSWHYHDSHAGLFDWLPEGEMEWDGHDTSEKYRRVDIFSRTEKKGVG